jgi:hypothetical protein
MPTPINMQIDEALTELETLTDEIRVQLHLATMDANDFFGATLEPRLFDARRHALEAKTASMAAIRDTIDAFKNFQKVL